MILKNLDISSKVSYSQPIPRQFTLMNLLKHLHQKMCKSNHCSIIYDKKVT